MIYSDITALKSKINQLYSNKTPFFFIVNYEQTEGYCIEAPLNQREIFLNFPMLIISNLLSHQNV